MPYQCVKCGAVYPDESDVLLKGCPICSSKFFFYFKKESMPKAQEIELTKEDRKQIESDIKGIIGPEEERPVILDLESINARKPGKFEIDLVSLFKGKPLVYKIEEGKYIIDLASSFQLLKNRHDDKK